MTSFIGVSFGVIDNRLVCVATSESYSLVNMNGLSSREALAFLWSIVYLRDDLRKAEKRKLQIPIVTFDCAVDIELVLRDVPARAKDVLFGYLRQQENRNSKDNPLFDSQSEDYRGVAHVYGYKLSQLPGKIFRVAPGPHMTKHSGLALYDVSSYFDCNDVTEAAAKFLANDSKNPVTRLEKNLLPLWTAGLAEQIMDAREQEAKLIVELAEKVETTIQPLGVTPRQWYGPSAIAARCLHKWEARKQAKRLHVKNSASELLHAVDCAYFGGRVEALKLGTIKDVRTFDLNSAYAYATTLLSQFYTPLRFTRKFDASEPFSCWLVDYELPEATIIGVLPTRSPSGGISFRKRGRGYFWQPEVDYLCQRYPESFSVKWGYVGSYNQVTFAGDVERMYDYRNELKAKDDAGEAIVKLALSNLYGKFAQNTGTAHFQCRAWAGWITSLVRRLLLEAVTGVEDRVICFCQDAVHLEGSEGVGVKCGELLGQWKRAQFAEGLYVSPGIYDLRMALEVSTLDKRAQRGSNLQLDFQRIARELSSRQVTELTRSFFVGYQLSRNAPLKYGQDYLSEVSESLELIPSKLRARNYLAEFDWATESRDSTINRHFSGQLSARYVPQEFQTHQAALRLRLKDRGWA